MFKGGLYILKRIFENKWIILNFEQTIDIFLFNEGFMRWDDECLFDMGEIHFVCWKVGAYGVALKLHNYFLTINESISVSGVVKSTKTCVEPTQGIVIHMRICYIKLAHIEINTNLGTQH